MARRTFGFRKRGPGASKISPLGYGPKRVKVGLVAGEADSENVDKAFWNEFGTETIPERPFLRNAMRNNRDAYRAAMRTAAKTIIGTAARGGDARGAVTLALRKLGLKAADDVKSEITALSDPPNAPSTVARKGSSNPLIDSGEMRNAVSSKVEE